MIEAITTQISHPSESAVNGHHYSPLIESPVIAQVEQMAEAAYQNSFRGRLIARAIAMTRTSRCNPTFPDHRGRILSRLSEYGNDAKAITRFIARLDKNPLADQRIHVNSLLRLF